MLADYIREHPDIWKEDIGEIVDENNRASRSL